MEYFTRGTNKFYRGKDGQIYLKGDGTVSYKNKLIEGMHIDVYMAGTNPRTVAIELVDESEPDPEVTTLTQPTIRPACPPMRDEWLTYESDIPSTKRFTGGKRRRAKTTKRNKRVHDDRTTTEHLIYCHSCEVHHGPEEPCVNYCDMDDDLGDYLLYPYYPSYSDHGCCCIECGGWSIRWDSK
jgi:ribosomal protein L32